MDHETEMKRQAEANRQAQDALIGFGQFGQSGQFGTGVKAESPFDRLDHARDHLAEARAKVRGLADRLVGPELKPQSEKAPDASSSLISRVDANASELTSIARDIIEAVSRIEARL